MELIDVAAMWLDVGSDLRCSDFAIPQAEATHWLELQLMTSPLAPTLAAVKILLFALRPHGQSIISRKIPHPSLPDARDARRPQRLRLMPVKAI